MKNADTYSKVKTFEFPNMVVRVQIPDLTPDERERRIKTIHSAAQKLLQSKQIKEKKVRQCIEQAIQ